MSSFILSELLTLADLIKELTAITQLSHQEDRALVLIDLEQTDDVRMCKVLEDVDFVFQSDLLLGIEVELVDHLDSPDLASSLLHRLPHLTKGARTKDGRGEGVVL